MLLCMSTIDCQWMDISLSTVVLKESLWITLLIIIGHQFLNTCSKSEKSRQFYMALWRSDCRQQDGNDQLSQSCRYKQQDRCEAAPGVALSQHCLKPDFISKQLLASRLDQRGDNIITNHPGFRFLSNFSTILLSNCHKLHQSLSTFPWHFVHFSYLAWRCVGKTLA